MPKPIDCFYFAPRNLHVPHMPRKTTPLISVGQILTLPPQAEITLCRVGFHASRNVLDAVMYRPFGRLTNVHVWGDVVSQTHTGNGRPKLCGRNRKTVAILSVQRTEVLKSDVRDALIEYAFKALEKTNTEGSWRKLRGLKKARKLYEQLKATPKLIPTEGQQRQRGRWVGAMQKNPEYTRVFDAMTQKTLLHPQRPMRLFYSALQSLLSLSHTTDCLRNVGNGIRETRLNQIANRLARKALEV